MIKSPYFLQEFLNYAIGFNDLEKSKVALEAGLNKEPDFHFNNPRIYLAFLQARGTDIPKLMIDFGFDKQKMIDIINNSSNSASCQYIITFVEGLMLEEKLQKELPTNKIIISKIKL